MRRHWEVVQVPVTDMSYRGLPGCVARVWVRDPRLHARSFT